MAKTFMLSISNLKDHHDVKIIEDYFYNNLKGVEKVDVNLTLNLVSVTYNDSIGSSNYILDALNRLGYSVR
ncbi:MAG TPA: copper chaperone [Firmicutes bacterium]|nr:copper chaperone [Bacillota bacterium]